MTPRLPFSFARDHQVVLEHGQLLVGPQASSFALREARRRAGQALVPVFLTQEAFETRLAALYQAASPDRDAVTLLAFDLEPGAEGTGPRDLLEDAAEAPVIQLVNQLLRRAVIAGTSDLHVEPLEEGLRARMRIDGFLQTVMDRRDVPVRRVISRLKVMAALDISETRLRALWLGLLLRLPVTGRLIRLAVAAQYLRTLALITGSRQTVLAAVQGAAEVLSAARFRAEAERVAEAVRAGESLSQALRHLSPVPAVARQLVDAGEQAAQLAPITARAAQLVESWLASERKRLAAILDPVLMMLVGAMVLVIVLSVLLPIFDLQAAF